MVHTIETKKIVIVLPVFNDWTSLKEVSDRIQRLSQSIADSQITLCIINDGSTEGAPNRICTSNHVLLNLNRNIGHQRAIAVGLSYVVKNIPCHCVIIMDSDGEDIPEHVPVLYTAHLQNPDSIIFASRARRREQAAFKIGYVLYKNIFHLLTGIPIKFGNFSLIPFSIAKKIVHNPDLWNNYASAVSRSRLKYSSIPLDRGKRISGSSKMNILSLMLHGLSAISVYADNLALRLMMASLIIGLFAGTGLIMVVVIRFFTDLGIPGWASTMAVGASIMIIQSFLSSVLLLFFVLSMRTQEQIIPYIAHENYIFDVKTDSGSL